MYGRRKLAKKAKEEKNKAKKMGTKKNGGSLSNTYKLKKKMPKRAPRGRRSIVYSKS